MTIQELFHPPDGRIHVTPGKCIPIEAWAENGELLISIGRRHYLTDLVDLTDDQGTGSSDGWEQWWDQVLSDADEQPWPDIEFDPTCYGNGREVQ